MQALERCRGQGCGATHAWLHEAAPRWLGGGARSAPRDGARLARSARGGRVQGWSTPRDGARLAPDTRGGGGGVQGWSTLGDGARLARSTTRGTVQGWNLPCDRVRLGTLHTGSRTRLRCHTRVAAQGWHAARGGLVQGRSTLRDGTACTRFSKTMERAHVPRGCWCKVCTPSDSVSFAQRRKVTVRGTCVARG